MSKIEQLSEALRGSLVANEELKRINRRLANASREPIAILAASCRLPGGVRSGEQLWQLVEAGVDAIGPLPRDRGWRLEELLESRGETQANREMWQGGFLEDAAAFDAAFFGISDREALAMDPQHRLLLETTWDLLESAGIVPGSLKKTSTGVFIGTTYQAYVPPIYQKAPDLDGYRLQGGLSSMASGRIAYTFGFNGPAVTVDTACSSSLTALHLAVQSLRAEECSLAIAGGATVVSSPEVYVEFARQKGLAADGRCKAFSEQADGTSFSEGVGAVLLARLSDAVKAGYPILAVIRGSAINNDGASNGLTAPSGPAQEKLIRKALKNAGLSVADIDIVEAHGTGTSLGDPIEANALINTYGQGRPEGQPLWLGSLKSNVGHVQAAAGVVGLIKMVMALKHGVMPRTLHAEVPSSRIEWSAGDVSLLTNARPWPNVDRPRRAAVSSFGFSGTNCHVILEQAPQPDKSTPEAVYALQGLSLGGLLPISAATPAGLQAQGKQLAEFIRAAQDEDVPAICAAWATTRTHFDHRAACAVSGKDELVAALDALAKGQPANGLTQGVRIASASSAFLFSGQGAQWPGMGRQLYESVPVFAQCLDTVLEHFKPYLPRSLKEIMFAEAGTAEATLLDSTDFTQPALFAIEVALYRTLEHLGVVPDFLCGHSIGEIAAAHVAGVFKLSDAAKFVAARGRLMQEISTPGAMIAIEARESEILETLSGFGERVAIAAINSPNSVVVSGDRDDVFAVEEIWKARGVRTSRLRVSHAFHSAHIQAIVEDLRKVVASTELRAPSIPVVSTVTGVLLEDAQACSADYWARQARGAVRYADAVDFLHHHDVSTFIEIGPDAVLATLAQTNLATASPISAREARTLAVMRRHRDETRVFTGALANLYVRGQEFDWRRLTGGTARQGLPTYPFQRRKYWFKPNPAQTAGSGRTDRVHPFLQPGVELADQQGYLFAGRMRTSEHSWLLDHAIDGVAINAGAATAEFILWAGAEIGLTRLDNLVLLERLPLPEDAAVEIQLRIGDANADGGHPVDVYFRLPAALREEDSEDGKPAWRRHATARLVRSDGASQSWTDLQQWPPQHADPVEHSALYERLDKRGVHLGPAFQLITRAWRRGSNIYVEADLPPLNTNETPGFRIHPSLLDASIQASLLQAETDGEVRQLFSISGLQIYQDNVRSIRACVEMKFSVDEETGHSEHSVRVVDSEGAVVAEIDSVVLRAGASAGQMRKPSAYTLKWRAMADLVSRSAPSVCWIGVGFDVKGLPSSEVGGQVCCDVPEALRAMEAQKFDLVALVCGGSELRSAEDAYAPAMATLRAVQTWLSEPKTQGLRLFVITQHAVATSEQYVKLNLAQAAVWGLLRSAQLEYPDRLVLLDNEGESVSGAVLGTALSAVSAGETQLAIRSGQLLVPRLTRHPMGRPQAGSAHTASVRPIDKEGTVLITGAGSLGMLAARRLAHSQRVKRIVLASRRGSDAPGVAELVKELTELGIEATAVKCDVADRTALSQLIRTLPEERPLTAVIHTAGVSKPVAFADLNEDDVAGVMASKIDAAWHLHELTKGMDLAAFILFSSAVGVVGLPDQSHYGAANTFLDALAAYRRNCDLPATSLAWGIWDHRTEMGEQLGADRLVQVVRAGFQPISVEYGLRQLEAVLDVESAAAPALLIPAKFDLRRMESASNAALLAELVSKPRTKVQQNVFIAQYAALDHSQRLAFLLKVVTDLTCKVLRNPDPSSVAPGAEFRALGFDSLTSIEMASDLSAMTALSLPAAAVFDHPTPLALADFLDAQLAARDSSDQVASPVPGRSAPSGSESLGRLLQRAIMEGRTLEGRAILKAAASFRPSFASPAPVGATPRITWLSRSGAPLLLICLDSFIPSVGAYTYQRLAHALGAAYEIAAVSLPGYEDGESLPIDIDAFSDVMVKAVQACANGRPFALAGFSTGGLAAHAVAERLESTAAAPNSVILIDTFHPEVMTDDAMEAALSEWSKTAENLVAHGDAGATAMAWYLDLFLNNWTPAKLKSPLCLIQAMEGLSQTEPESWADAWGPLASRATTPGRHFTLLREDVAHTAAKVAEMANLSGQTRRLRNAF